MKINRLLILALALTMALTLAGCQGDEGEDSSTGIDMTEFAAVDMDGNEVDASVFKDYDVTMVNCWATWCQYCVQEMPAIQALYAAKPDNVNVITICADAADDEATCLQELDQAGAGFMTLQGNEELEDRVLSKLTGYPTTFFVDSSGKVVGQLQVGAPAQGEDQILEAYSDLIDQALEEVN